MRSICLSFPDAVETETWGKPHFRVKDKIFAGCGEEDGKMVLGCKLQMQHAKRMIQTPGFWTAEEYKLDAQVLMLRILHNTSPKRQRVINLRRFRKSLAGASGSY